MLLESTTRRHVVFALDQSATMDLVDPEGVRIQGVEKLMRGLSASDEIGLVLFDDTARIAVPLVAATDANVAMLLNAARGSVPGTASPDLNAAMSTALGMVPQGSDGVLPSVILVSSARWADDEDVVAATRSLLRSSLNFPRASVDLFVISLDPYADKAQALTSVMRDNQKKFKVENGNGLPQVFGKILAQIQGYAGRPRVARLDPSAEKVSRQGLDETISIAPYTELLQLDIVSESDAAGVIGFSVALADPDGNVVKPQFEGTGNAFYRIPMPMPGKWRYQVMPQRKARVIHQVITDNGLKIFHYCPSAVELAKAIPLYFGVVTPGGPVAQDNFKMGGSKYSLARGEVTFTAPDGSTEVIRADLGDRQSDYAGLYRIKGWRAGMDGSYDVDVAIYMRRNGNVHGELFELHNLAPITIKGVADRSDLPLLALASVEPSATDSRPIPIVDAEGRAHVLRFYAEVIDPGVAEPLPYMLGRSVRATVRHGSGFSVDQETGIASLTTSGRNLARKPFVELVPDTTVSRRVQYGFPTLATPSLDKILFEDPGYYRVELQGGPTYQVDPSRASVVKQVGNEPMSASALGMLALGALIAMGGAALYLLIEWGKLDLAPRGGPELPDDVLIEDEATFNTFTDVFDENLFSMPQNVPLEIAVFEQGMLTNHTRFDRDEHAETYIVKVVMGSAYINGSPVTEDFDLHMRPEDQFQVGDFKAGIQGIEKPHFVIQFLVEDVGESTVVNVITDTGVSRWTITANLDKRVPPQPGETLTLDFSERDEMFIARDEGLEADVPMDIALYHESIGVPHAKLTKQTYLNGSVGYGIAAVRGSLYVNDTRLEPGEAIEEFSPGATLKVGRFTFKYNWEQGPDAQYPVLEFLEAPDPIALPIGDLDDITGDAVGPMGEDGDEDDDAALDSLFADGDGDADDADSDDAGDGDVDALSPEDTDDIEALIADAEDVAASDEVEGLDDMLAPLAEDEAPSAEDAEAVPDLDDLAPMDDDAEESEGETQEAADPSEEASEETSDLDALIGDEATQEEPAVEPSDEVSDLDALIEDQGAQQATASEPSEEASDDEGAQEEATADDEPGASTEEDAEAPTLDALVGEGDAPPEGAEEDAPSPEPTTDVNPTTGLPTVERFGEQLGEDWASADEGDLPMSIILLDVSRAVTADPDVAGTAARLLAGEFSAAGTVSHAGDNQFALLLMNIALDDAIEIAGLIQTALGSVMPSAAERISVGVSERRGSREDDAASYLRSLREAMDEGVAAGQNFVVYG